MLSTVVHNVNKVIGRFTNLLLIIMTLAVFAQVISRFLLEHPLAWSEELARYLMIWITFLGASLAIEKKAHPMIEIFAGFLPGRTRQVVQVIALLVSSVFYSLLIYFGSQFAVRSFGQLTPAMGLPIGYVYLIIPISGVLLLISSFAEIEKIIKRGKLI
ncbi:TRAP transporter small permease [Desulfosporosinus sp. BICA1-9]|uniref:TRAP transporter small permease n=1 Tax=Desulfosporosinus sp. BICA1-9 TaxID=1531958 RepID=UPI0005F1FFCE|nr:TRAP transporter small permease [Desulfosporosinus sp. BICA1-9]KJS49092.1 MAG: hypothetical protein VR66_10545 [Peptococcaceae bacterium BRH_c23]KJS89797.1 MAG: hypothetical protein JL57_05310 [Desulfosporosinus sp. BICA1-9]HBW36669.1 TRAP transporter small permease [Desulfosporosinus sp.]